LPHPRVFQPIPPIAGFYSDIFSLTFVSKDESKKLSEKLRQSEESHYNRMRKVVSETDRLTVQVADMENQQAEYQLELDVDRDPIIIAQVNTMLGESICNLHVSFYYSFSMPLHARLIFRCFLTCQN
jgi:hypothetical protein